MIHTLKTFTDQVHKMRLAQGRVADLITLDGTGGMVTSDQKTLQDAVAIAENLEKQVDQSIQEINKSLATPTPDPQELMDDVVNKLKSSIDNENF